MLSKPEGPGPFPAVVILHTCGGVRSHTSRFWPDVLRQHGYVALTVDSFGSRGLTPCPNRLIRPGVDYVTELAPDAFGALDYLASLPGVDKNRIAEIGFSLGGYVLKSVA